MSRLTIVGYNDPDQAEEVRLKLRKLQREYVIDLNLDPEIWQSSSSSFSIQWTSAPRKEPDFPATILFRWSKGEISTISSTSTTTSTSTSFQLSEFTLKDAVEFRPSDYIELGNVTVNAIGGWSEHPA